LGLLITERATEALELLLVEPNIDGDNKEVQCAINYFDIVVIQPGISYDLCSVVF